MTTRITNNFRSCCDNEKIWQVIFDYKIDNFEKYLNKKHVVNTWFILKKCNELTNFINEWCDFNIYKLNDKPLIIYHHTVDQSIFNILVNKYKFKTFYHPSIKNEKNKNFHYIMHFINNYDDDINDLFITP